MDAKLTFLVVFIVLFSKLFSQEAPKVKFEKISNDELKMAIYESDTTAEAVILYDEGSSLVKYDVSEGQFKLYYSRFVRLKILKQNGAISAFQSIQMAPIKKSFKI